MNQHGNQNSSVNISWSGEAAREVGPIEGAVQSVGYEQANTNALIDDLAMRLEAVLRPMSETKNGPQAVRAYQSPLHGSVNDKIDAQVAINDRLRSLIERVAI